MKESLIISVLIVFIYIFLFVNKRKLVLMESSNSGHKFLVHNDKLKSQSANLLSDIILRMYKLRNHLVNNIDNYPEFRDSIKLLEQNFHNSRTKED